MPRMLIDLWTALAPASPPAEACLINFYTPEAKMGLHQDRDEEAFDAPVVSVSLGDTATFRIGGTSRNALRGRASRPPARQFLEQVVGVSDQGGALADQPQAAPGLGRVDGAG